MIAAIAAYNMNAQQIAIVIGRTIHLHKTTKEELLQNKRWLRHEIAHVHQWAQIGLIKFLFAYLVESFNKGYLNNRFEIEARKKENDESIMQNVIIV